MQRVRVAVEREAHRLALARSGASYLVGLAVSRMGVSQGNHQEREPREDNLAVHR
jgi:hypothetical protein